MLPRFQPIVQRKAVALLYGALCHGLFIAGVGMMIFHMYFGMSRSFGRIAAPWDAIANALLLLQFPLLHSLLLMNRGRAVLKRLAPSAFASDLSPTTYVILASLQTLLLFSLWTPSAVIWWQAEGAVRGLLTFLYAASWLMLGKAILDAGIGLQTGSIGWWAVLNSKRPAYPGMPTRGLFRLCRQPIYVAFALTLWTVPVWTPDQLAIAVGLTAYCLLGPLFKEARFLRLFGNEFAAYKRDHRYWLPIPKAPVKRNDLTIYDQYAALWWSDSVRWLRTLHNLVPARLAYFDRLINWRGKAVLDLGCGGGFMAEALATRGARVTGIDLSASAIAIASEHAARQNLPIRYLNAEGESVPLADRCMDAVVCVDVLEHVADLDAVLREISRVLKPQGLFFYDTINRSWPAHFFLIVAGEKILRLLPKGTHDGRKFIKPQELVTRLEDNGFATDKPVGLGPCGFNQRLDILFSRLPTTAIMYMGCARKN